MYFASLIYTTLRLCGGLKSRKLFQWWLENLEWPAVFPAPPTVCRSLQTFYVCFAFFVLLPLMIMIEANTLVDDSVTLSAYTPHVRRMFCLLFFLNEWPGKTLLSFFYEATTNLFMYFHISLSIILSKVDFN